mmetsp:Transcript_45674/g.103120  ORF Transcript_45674/g.103120 Transcript_45674/m.103120 type:complete len:933 (-) Transcript_45674:151-2949(-)
MRGSFNAISSVSSAYDRVQRQGNAGKFIRVQSLKSKLVKQRAAKRKAAAKIAPDPCRIPPKYIRFDQCYDFRWSSTLWRGSSRKIERMVVLSTLVYAGVASWMAWYDGLRGVDIPYFISTTLSTVGIGDISPQSAVTRGATLILLPFGVSIVGFAISLAIAYSKTELNAIIHELDRDDTDEPTSSGNATGACAECRMIEHFLWSKIHMVAHPVIHSIRRIMNKFSSRYPIGFSAFYVIFKYASIVTLGALYPLFDSEERRIQRSIGNDMTVVDCFFFSTVVSSTVGYGHRLWPLTDGFKLFLTLYMLVASVTVAKCLHDLAELYVSYKSDQINGDIVNHSTTWVHKADLLRIKRVSQAQFVLFKLQQLKQVNDQTLIRLSERFAQLDLLDRGFLVIGTQVPSAPQLERIQSLAQGTDRTLEATWEELRRSDEFKVEIEEADPVKSVDPKGRRPIRVRGCHEFTWSRKLWLKAAVQSTTVVMGLLVINAALGVSICASDKAEDMSALECVYFLSASVSSVGLGDYAAVEQDSRGLSILLIPLLLINFGALLASVRVHAMSRLPARVALTDADRRRLRVEALAKKVPNSNPPNCNEPPRMMYQQQIVEAGVRFGLSQPEARQVFEALDVAKARHLPVDQGSTKWAETAGARLAFLLVKLYGTVLVGAVLFKVLEADQGYSFLEAMYFATVVATTTGYGDIVPLSTASMVVFSFYFIAATVSVGGVLAGFVECFALGIVGEKIVKRIVDSTVFVHKADVNGTGVITESDFILFKLVQLQMVDPAVLEDLVDRFLEIDVAGEGWLDVGFDVPSAEQVDEMKIEVAGTEKTLAQAWDERKPRRTIKQPLPSPSGQCGQANGSSDANGNGEAGQISSQRLPPLSVTAGGNAVGLAPIENRQGLQPWGSIADGAHSFTPKGSVQLAPIQAPKSVPQLPV